MNWLQIIADIAQVLGVIWVLFFGGRAVVEVLRDRLRGRPITKPKASTITNVLLALILLAFVSSRFIPISTLPVTTTPRNVMTPSPSLPSSPTVNGLSPTVSAPTSSATALPTIRDNRTFSLIAGHDGFITSQLYTGTVMILVSGTGQAKQTALSDPLYIYTDFNGNLITPYHDPNFSLCINDNSVDKIIIATLLKYNDNHVYTFMINAPGGQLKFGICDSGAKGQQDNTGFFTVTVSQ